MPEFLNRETVQLTNREITPEGFMKVKANVARTGVLDYYLFDFPQESLPNELKNAPRETKIRALYSADEVFAKDSLDSIIDKPVTNGHPSENVSSQNARFFTRGFVKNAKKKGEFVSTDLLITDATLINQIEQGEKEECSTGIRSEVDWNAGEDPSFGAYDVVFKNIRVNHVAIVFKGRAGEKVRLANELANQNKGDRTMPDNVKRTYKGIEIEFSNQAAQAFDTLLSDFERVSEENKTLSTDLENSKKELSETQGKLDATKAELDDSGRIDKLVNARTELVTNAKKLCPKIETDGKGEVEIKKEVINTVNEKIDLSEKDDTYINAVFDTLVASRVSDNGSRSAVNDAFNNAGNDDEKPSVKARNEMIKRNREAWKDNK